MNMLDDYKTPEEVARMKCKDLRRYAVEKGLCIRDLSYLRKETLIAIVNRETRLRESYVSERMRSTSRPTEGEV